MSIADSQNRYRGNSWNAQIRMVNDQYDNAKTSYNQQMDSMKFNTWGSAADSGNTRGSFNGYAVKQGQAPLDLNLKAAGEQRDSSLAAIQRARAAAAAAQAARDKAAAEAAAQEKKIKAYGFVKDVFGRWVPSDRPAEPTAPNPSNGDMKTQIADYIKQKASITDWDKKFGGYEGYRFI